MTLLSQQLSLLNAAELQIRVYMVIIYYQTNTLIMKFGFFEYNLLLMIDSIKKIRKMT